MMRRSFISLLSALVLLGACTIQPPLYLRETLAVEVELKPQDDVDRMWQPDWRSLWTFRWSEDALGPLGYKVPPSFRAHVYPLDERGAHARHDVYNFFGLTTEFPVVFGHYDFLFHNNDSEVLLFSTAEGTVDDVFCNTRIFSRGLKASTPVSTVQQKRQSGAAKADADIEIEEPVALMPDGLFSCLDANRLIPSDLSQYTRREYRYVLRIEELLYPATYIHLVQVRLVNNDGRVIGSPSGAALTGVADGVNLSARVSATATVSVPSDVYMDRERDMLATRVLSFGIPGCDPYDPKSVAATTSRHFLVLNVAYNNGSHRNIRIDITDQFRALPLGGVIDLELDVDDFPPEGGAEGGFEALIEDWTEETGHATIIN